MWNAEGLKNSIYSIKEFLQQKSPSMAFISESQAFQSDISPLMKHIQGEYCYFLNSEDLHDPDSALMRNTTAGGTLLLWKKSLDPFISIHPVETSAFTPLILKLPGCIISVHIALYLPTHGKDASFISELANLRICLEELNDLHPGCIIFIRGDSNVNKKNKSRVPLLDQLQQDFSLKRVMIPHNTYHHFVGDGEFDSQIDVILHTNADLIEEKITDILCKHENPLVLSHHDVVLSCVHLPTQPATKVTEDLITAPRVTNEREKIVWSPEGVQNFSHLVSPQLKLLRESWLDSSSPASMSVLLKMTNYVLGKTASKTNKAISLAHRPTPKSAPTPKAVLSAKHQLNKARR